MNAMTRAWWLGWCCLLLGRFSFGTDLWERALAESKTHRFSTLITAQDVRDRLGTEDGLAQAIRWCRETAVTKVYVESFRDGYQADGAALERVRDRLRAAGLEVSGCVTPTNVGKKSNRWNIIGCYTDEATQRHVQEIFEFTARRFDEIMIDDFWFTDCSCSACDAARGARKVNVGARETAVSGAGWEEYRRELMTRISEERVIGPAKRVNPACRLIIKYPQWYDAFHERGYDVDGETRIFDRIWVGTETRDYEDRQWGGTVQYEAYFIMRWLGGIGGEKCGGGWYDWLGTTERTYVEQARQTVLGGAHESLLFCYGGLQSSTGPRDVEAFRGKVPELWALAKEVGKRQPTGVAAFKPTNSAPGSERRVFDFVGMLGIPLVPTHEFPTNALAAFFSVHALKVPDFEARLEAFLTAGHRAILTDGLTARLPERVWKGRDGVRVLSVRGDPKSLLGLTGSELDGVRGFALAPWKLTLRGPNQVAFCLFSDGSQVIQNFGATAAEVEVGGGRHRVGGRDWVARWTR